MNAPQVMIFGGPNPYPIRHVVQLSYEDDLTAGLRWVAMDQAFLNDFLPAMAQQGVHVEWVSAEST